MTVREGGNRSGLGWAILAAALAFPALLFYSWSSRLKAEHDKALSARARERVPAGGFFAIPPAARRPNAAIALSTAASTITPTTTMNTPKPVVAAASSSTGSVSAATARPAAPATTPEVVFSSAPAEFVLPRDPLISPVDMVRLAEYQADLDRVRHANEHPRIRVASRKRERPIQDDVRLQGIVTTPEGRPLAIVNDATLGAGSFFTAPGHPGRVKIVRISSDAVWFVYKNKPFKKIVTTE